MRRTAAFVLAAGGIAVFAAAAFSACSGKAEGNATIWTDVPELAIAVELFDAREGPAKAIVAERANGPYADIYDFCKRVDTSSANARGALRRSRK